MGRSGSRCLNFVFEFGQGVLDDGVAVHGRTMSEGIGLSRAKVAEIRVRRRPSAR
jgi:hypothetical protein